MNSMTRFAAVAAAAFLAIGIGAPAYAVASRSSAPAQSKEIGHTTQSPDSGARAHGTDGRAVGSLGGCTHQGVYNKGSSYANCYAVDAVKHHKTKR